MKSPWGSSALYCRCIYLTKHKDNISNIESKINSTFWLLVFCIFNGVICQIRIKIRGQVLLRFLSIHIKSEISWVTASLVERVLFPLNIPWNTVYILPVAKSFMNKQASESESRSIEFPRSPTDTLHNLIRRIFSHTSFHSLENLSKPSSEDWGSWNILIISVLFHVQASRLDAFCPSQKMWFYR